MKSYTLVVAFVTTLLYIEYANAHEICRAENCIVPDACELLMKGNDYLCHQQGTSCCNVVKSEFRTHCHQHGGVCMDKCSPFLQHNTVDCTDGTVCCVLV